MTLVSCGMRSWRCKRRLGRKGTQALLLALETINGIKR